MANNWQFQFQLPDRFTGQTGEVITPWFEKVEHAMRAIAPNLDDNEFGQRMCAIIPVRLSGPADKVYQSLPEGVRNNYQQLRTELSRIFNNEQFLRKFRDSLTARVRAPKENIEVYLAELRTLVAQAFPTYDQPQRESEVHRRLIAGLDAFSRGKVHEQGAVNIQDVIEIVKNLERAQEHYQTAGYVFSYSPLNPLGQLDTTPQSMVAGVEAKRTKDADEPSLKQLYDMIQDLQINSRSRGPERRRDKYDNQYNRSHDRSFSRDRYVYNRSQSRSPSTKGYKNDSRDRQYTQNHSGGSNYRNRSDSRDRYRNYRNDSRDRYRNYRNDSRDRYRNYRNDSRDRYTDSRDAKNRSNSRDRNTSTSRDRHTERDSRGHYDYYRSNSRSPGRYNDDPKSILKEHTQTFHTSNPKEESKHVRFDDHHDHLNH